MVGVVETDLLGVDVDPAQADRLGVRAMHADRVGAAFRMMTGVVGQVTLGVVAVVLCVLAFFAYRKWQMSKKIPATTTATDSKFDSVSGDRA